MLLKAGWAAWENYNCYFVTKGEDAMACVGSGQFVIEPSAC